MTQATRTASNRIGLVSMAIAAAALFVSVVHLAAGPFNPPPPPIEEQIADTAVKIKDAARRAMTGAPAPTVAPEEASFDIDRAVTIAGLSLAGLAMAAGLIALGKNEQQPPAFIGFALGGAVLLMTWLQWVALAICALVVVAAIVFRIGDILSF